MGADFGAPFFDAGTPKCNEVTKLPFLKYKKLLEALHSKFSHRGTPNRKLNQNQKKKTEAINIPNSTDRSNPSP